MRWLLVLMVACSAPPSRSSAKLEAPALDPGDMCPNDSEDRDGFQDDDGCPDPDNDQDRIVDIDDKCPNDPETYNGTDDTDGCPDRGCVVVRAHPLCIQDWIYFARAKGVPQALYEPILDNIAEAMKLTSPDIELVELSGFRSGDEPRTLSHQRAATIHALLVKRGVDAARLVIVDGGVGAPSDAPNGQRRVALEIVKQRVRFEDAESTTCTPMGRYFRRFTDEERRAACGH